MALKEFCKLGFVLVLRFCRRNFISLFILNDRDMKYNASLHNICSSSESLESGHKESYLLGTQDQCLRIEGQVIGIPSAGELEKMLNAASRSSRLAVLYFTATWCGPCRVISPLYTSLAAKYPKVLFLKVDIDEARDAAACWNVSIVPTFFFIRNGKEIDKPRSCMGATNTRVMFTLLSERDSIVGGKEEETDYEDVEIQELIGGFDLKIVDVFKREGRLRATTAKTILRVGRVLKCGPNCTSHKVMDLQIWIRALVQQALPFKIFVRLVCDWLWAENY
ncbi:hypothetical protein RHMOL_Rhmol08G0181600 [Rhododendron molle]|uniref:Uncharacterized protein n=1 Tax=Rhododendron molle TaxID=49168 RepID=A0ACC0MPV3_RHOML|nr:hypothetical protein RHMOL_Rhmol08G0181600 [Rhododendron molle]